MSSKPEVSVCLPILDGEKFLSLAIESILDQTFSDFELLISDDGSNDASPEIVEKFARQDARITYWRNESAKGLFGNYNECLRRASGRFIKPFAQDDLLEREALAASLDALSSDPQLMLVSLARTAIDESGKAIPDGKLLPVAVDVLGDRRQLSGRKLLVDSLFPLSNFIGEPSAVLFRAAAIGDGFDERLYQLGDLEYWLRIALAGSYYHLDSPLCSFRMHSESASARNFKGLRYLTDALRVGRKFKGLFPQLGKSHDEYLAVNLIAFADSIEQWVSDGRLTIADLRDVNDADLIGPQCASMASGNGRIAAALEDLADLREVCVRSLLLMRAGIDSNGVAGQVNPLQRNEAKIKNEEAKLHRLLSSASWRMTRPFRELNRAVRDSAAIEDDFDKASLSDDGGLNPMLQQERYLHYLTKKIRSIKLSRSWRFTKSLRFPAR